jgi:MFS family permease
LILILSHNFYVSLAAFFILGVCAAGRASVGYFLAMELLPTERVRFASSIFMCLDNSINIFATLYFMIISNNSLYWELFALFASVSSLIAVIFFIPESPSFLYEKGLIGDARMTLLEIAEKNGISKNKATSLQVLDEILS